MLEEIRARIEAKTYTPADLGELLAEAARLYGEAHRREAYIGALEGMVRRLQAAIDKHKAHKVMMALEYGQHPGADDRALWEARHG